MNAAVPEPRPVRPERGRRLGTPLIIAIVLLATAISIGAQRFLFGHANNAYHIPIVLDYTSLPQFQGDAFHDTLERYASAVYPVLRLFASESNIAGIFFAAHVITRALTLYMLLALLLVVARPSAAAATLHLVALAIAPPLLGVSPIGRHDLMPIYFTHSSLVLPLATAAFLAAGHARDARAGVWGGLTFCVNAFAGVWTAIALAAVALFGPRDATATTRLRHLARIAAVFALVSAPVIAWMLSVGAIGAGSAPDFDFRDYLRAYYTAHTWIGGRDPADYVAFVQVAGVGAIALAVCRPLRGIAAAFAACCVIFAAGIALPWLTAERMLLNLYPLRVDALLVFLGIGAFLPALLWLVTNGDVDPQQHSNAPNGRAAGGDVDTANGAAPYLAVAVIATAVGSFVAMAALLALALRARGRMVPAVFAALLATAPLLPLPGGTTTISPAAYVLVFTVAIGLGFLVWSQRTHALIGAVGILAADLLIEGWLLGVAAAVLLALALWFAPTQASGPTDRRARVRTAAPAIRRYAVPLLAALLALCVVRSARAQLRHLHFLESVRSPQAAAAAWARANTAPSAVFLVPVYWGDFQWRARRPVWVEWKQGAAVMWAPEFHAVWQPRFTALRDRHDAASILEYGCTVPVDYMVVPDATAWSDLAVYRGEGWIVVESSHACAASRPATLSATRAAPGGEARQPRRREGRNRTPRGERPAPPSP